MVTRETLQGKKQDPPQAMVFQKRFLGKPAYKSNVMIEINISYPQASAYGKPAVSQKISAFYRLGARRYCEYASKELYGQAVKEFQYGIQNNVPFRTFQAVQNYTVSYNRSRLLSIYYDRYEYTAGAHGNTIRAADTWQLSGGGHMELSDFFEGSFYKSVIFEYIINEVKQEIEAGSSYFLENYVKNVFRYFDEKNYYLTDSGIAVFYQLYTIAAYAQGIPVFIIPYETFGPGLKRHLFE